MNDAARQALHRYAVSVIVCTHNPRPDYLDRTLDALRRQSVDGPEWELIVVDNASEPPLSSRVDLRSTIPSRLIREDTLGLTAARLAAIRHSSADLLLFVDDDNVLDPDFLRNAIRISREMPFLGAWSGQCRPEFEVTPPEWTRRYWGNLVIREFNEDTWSNLPRLAASMPCGAGLCVRRPVALHYLRLHETGARRFHLDRAGSSLVSGGDNDLAACACDVGLGMGLISSLKLTHLIPAERMTEDYLSRLAEGIYMSAVLLDSERGLPVNPRSIGQRLRDFVSTLRTGNPHRRILRAAHRGYDLGVRLLSDRA